MKRICILLFVLLTNFVSLSQTCAKLLGPSAGNSDAIVSMAICKKIVQTYQGEIFAKGQENIGAEFHVILKTQQHINNNTKTN